MPDPSRVLAVLCLLAAPVSASASPFPLELYKRAAAAAAGNLFLSPYSVAAALEMVRAGARGGTLSELDAALGPKGPAPLPAGPFELSSANALWGQAGFGFKKEFLDLLRTRHGAALREADFSSDAEGARGRINAWVAEATKDRIRDLIGQGVLRADTRLVLTNAIYFKGTWAEPFDKEETRDEPFHGPGAPRQVPMMRRTARFGYMETPSLQALELPYRGDRLSMLVLLPRLPGGLRALEQGLDEKALSGWLGKLSFREVEVHLPRFKTEAGLELSPLLRALGVRSAFLRPEEAGGADFSGMNGRRDLFLSAAIHKAFVDVNEEGTEAAAATAVTMTLAMVRESPPVFRADRPFLYMIRDRTSGSILFIGRLAEAGR